MKKDLAIGPTLDLPLDWLQLATVVYGNRGTGKTSFGRVVAEEAHRRGQRFCAIDLKGDWWGLKSTQDGKGEGLPVVVFGGEHADVPLEPDAGEFVAETVAELPQSCILDFEHFSKGKQIRFLAKFFAHLYHVNRNPLTLLSDEAQRYAPQKTFDTDSSICLGAVEDLVKLGRKHGISPILFTQRGAGLNKEVSELCDMLVAFRTPGPLDQDRVKDWLDANTTKAQRDEVMGKLSKLPTGTAVFASGHPDLDLFGVHPVRRPWTFDSSATPKIGERRVEPKRLAKPDLEALKAKMSEAITRAKENDPAALKRRIAELEAQLESPPLDEEPSELVELRRKIDERLGWRTLEDEEEADYVGRIEQVALESNHFRDTLLQANDMLSALQRLLSNSLPSGRTFVTRIGAIAKRARGATPKPAEKPAPGKSNGAGAGLSPGQAAVLQCVLQYPAGIDRRRLRMITGYARSTLNRLVKELNALRAVTGGDTVTPTSEGARLLPGVEKAPVSGRALREFWFERLTEGQKAVLSFLLKHRSGSDRDTISAETGYATSTRNRLIKELRALQLVETTPDAVGAAPEFFQ